MQEIVIGLPDISMRTKHVLLALFIAIVIVFSVVTKFNIIVIIVIIIFTIIILIIMGSSTGIDYSGSLPSTTYPIPPHLGLDGISLENRAGGQNI